MSDEATLQLPLLARVGHAQHCKICLQGLPSSQVDVDSARLALAFYCLGSLDLLNSLESRTNDFERQDWREWIWEQHTQGRYGTGFKPSSYMTPSHNLDNYTEFDAPHMITTYTALLSLSILKDDFSRLDRPGLLKFLRACQKDDGSFYTEPGQGGDSDIRTTYCAFAISSMLDDWSGIDVDRAIPYITACRTYEGGYGQSPFCEAQGGTTYCALASLYLAPSSSPIRGEPLTAQQRRQTIRWLVHNQGQSGGFHGRTEKEADACYCFWCGASLELLGAKDLVTTSALASFLARCQFKFGGIAKSPGEHPDPYHTYLSLAAISIHPPGPDTTTSTSWNIKPLDALINTTKETAEWARSHIPGQKIKS
ncbi:hypothetical protein PILCRDRAFT_793478 [Piloderma croceum F 1598]|uniref:Prenyltransferase alpha-alpha toroid domain-containing protein n=1 Tax=Piloderma croceum (strain F 1598) TaxID=765440 RepID=A0A0C3FEV5_PILCF|nr:hypothetical protein PILCRDRAFT_793478 [Piloderma croceum F 1598]